MVNKETAAILDQSSEGCMLTLGELDAQTLKIIWKQTYIETATTVKKFLPFQTIKITLYLFDLLSKKTSIEVYTALNAVDAALLPKEATEVERQQHYDCCVDAIDLVSSMLKESQK